MKRAKPGDIVSIEYKGLLTNGDVFESTVETGPLEFTIGTGSVMPAFELAVVGMSVGETSEIVVEPAEGYGIRQKELLQTINKSIFGDKGDLKIGQILHLNVDKEGTTHRVPATVIELADTTVTLDYNHPLAGHTLTYNITLKSIKESEDSTAIATDSADASPLSQ